MYAGSWTVGIVDGMSDKGIQGFGEGAMWLPGITAWE